jgi:hypothetical protein
MTKELEEEIKGTPMYREVFGKEPNEMYAIFAYANKFVRDYVVTFLVVTVMMMWKLSLRKNQKLIVRNLFNSRRTYKDTGVD